MPRLKKGFNYVSPNDSNDHTQLISILVKYDITKEQIEFFLFAINAPGLLIGLVMIAENIKRIIYIKKNIKLHSDDIDWDVWLEICKLIIKHKEEIGSQLNHNFLDLRPKNSETHIHRNWGFKRYPFFSTLANQALVKRSKKSYLQFSLLLLIAHVRWMSNNENLDDYQKFNCSKTSISDDYHKYVYVACNTLRKWSLKHNALSLQTHSINIFRNLHDFNNVIVKFENFHLANLTDSSLFIKLFFKIFNREIPKSSNSNARKKGNGRGSFIIDGCLETNEGQLLEKLESEIDEDISIDEQLEVFDLNKKVDIGDDKNEIDIPDSELTEEVLRLYYKNCKKNRVDLKKAKLNALGQLRAVSKSNQYFLNEYSNLQTCEIIYPIQYCISRLNEIRKFWQSNEHLTLSDSSFLEAEVLIYVLCNIFIAQPGDILINSVFLSKYDEEIVNSSMALLPHNRCWSINPFQIEYKTEITDTQQLACKELTDVIYLPDVADIHKYVSTMFDVRNKICKRLDREISALIFDNLATKTTSNKGRNRYIRKYLINELENKSRFTPHRIELFLANYLLRRKSWDIASVILLTNQLVKKGLTQVHYTTIKVNSLINDYIQDSHELIDSVNKELNYELLKKSSFEYIEQSKHVGSRYCPTTTFLQEYIEKLQDILSKENLHWKDYHNLYTVYVLQLLSFNTLHRAVEKPYFLEKDKFELKIPAHYSANLTNGSFTLYLVAVSDKDNIRKDKTRLAVLTDISIKQYELYRNHLKKIKKKLKSNNKKLHKFSVQSTFFLFTNEGAETPRPKNIRQLIFELFSLPLNINRHFIRSELVRLKIPKSLTNTILGHWFSGQEYFVSASMLSVQHIACNALVLLTDIQNELNWTPIESKVNING